MNYNKFWTNFNSEHYNKVLEERGVITPQREKELKDGISEDIDLALGGILLLIAMYFLYCHIVVLL